MVNESVTAIPFRLFKRVLPQHTDHGGVMWHGGYVAWLEEARVEALNVIDFPYQRFVAAGLDMPVVRLDSVTFFPPCDSRLLICTGLPN